MKNQKRYSGGLIFILFIPIGLFICLYLYDWGRAIYEQKKLDKDTEEILYRVLNRGGLTTTEEYKNYAIRLYQEYGYDTDEMSFLEIEGEDAFLLINYKRYLNMVGEISFEILRNDTSIVHSSYKGYYNEYKEAVVEKYVEDDEDVDEVMVDGDKEMKELEEKQREEAINTSNTTTVLAQ